MAVNSLKFYFSWKLLEGEAMCILVLLWWRYKLYNLQTSSCFFHSASCTQCETVRLNSQFTVRLLGIMRALKLWTIILWIFLCLPPFLVLLTVNLMCQSIFVIFYQITMRLGWWSSSHNSQLLLKCFYYDQLNIPLQNATFHKLFLWKFSPFCISQTCAVLLITFLKNLLMHTSIQITVFMW